MARTEDLYQSLCWALCILPKLQDLIVRVESEVRSDCADARADLNFAGRNCYKVHFILLRLIHEIPNPKLLGEMMCTCERSGSCRELYFHEPVLETTALTGLKLSRLLSLSKIEEINVFLCRFGFDMETITILILSVLQIEHKLFVNF